jgi:hypothetical protein
MPLTIALVLLLVFPALVSAQVRLPPQLADSSAAVILQRARAAATENPAQWNFVGGLLRQLDRQPAAKLDALADGLVAVAAAGRSGRQNERSYREAIEAISALVLAGAAQGDAENAYPGALDRLIRIHRETGPTPLRSLALRRLTTMPDWRRGLAYLREVAVSTDPTAEYAVHALVSEAVQGGMANNPEPARSEARAVLRALFNDDAVKEPRALEALRDFSAVQGWVKP